MNFVSETVLIGFKAGVALRLASTQLPKLFGVKGGHENFWERMTIVMSSCLAGAVIITFLPPQRDGPWPSVHR